MSRTICLCALLFVIISNAFGEPVSKPINSDVQLASTLDKLKPHIVDEVRGSSLTKTVNAAFPRLDVTQQRQTAVDTNVKALTQMANPNIAVSVTFADARAVLLGRISKFGVTDFGLEGDQQMVKADVKFDRTFGKDDAGKDAELASTLDKLKPHIVGEVVAYVGMTGGFTASTDTPTLELKLLPALSTVVVSRIEVAEKYDVTLAGKAITALLNRFKESLAAALTRSPLTTVPVPALSNKPLNISGPLKINDPNLKVSVSANPITPPMRVDGIASLVTSKQLTVIAQVSPVAVARQQQAVAVDNSYDGIEKRISDIVDHMLQVTDADSRTWVAIKKDVIAITTNAVFAQASVCTSATGALPAQHFAVPLQTPSGAGLNCNFTPNCPVASCPLTVQQAPACGSNVCIVPRPWPLSGCAQSGPNPLCPVQQAYYAQQALQNQQACQAKALATSAACLQVAAGKAALCKQDQQQLSLLNKTGPFAILTVDANVHTQDAKICMNSLLLSPALDRLDMAVDVTGTASADVHVDYDPKGAGLMLCNGPWHAQLPTLQASLRQPVLNISAQAAVVNDQNGLHIDFTVDKTTVKSTMVPGPSALLLKTPQMLYSCPAVALATPITIALAPLVPQLQGDIDIPVPEHKASVDVQPFSPKLGDRNVTVTVETGASSPAIVVSAALAKGPNGSQQKEGAASGVNKADRGR